MFCRDFILCCSWFYGDLEKFGEYALGACAGSMSWKWVGNYIRNHNKVVCSKYIFYPPYQQRRRCRFDTLTRRTNLFRSIILNECLTLVAMFKVKTKETWNLIRALSNRTILKSLAKSEFWILGDSYLTSYGFQSRRKWVYWECHPLLWALWAF